MNVFGHSARVLLAALLLSNIWHGKQRVKGGDSLGPDIRVLECLAAYPDDLPVPEQIVERVLAALSAKGVTISYSDSITSTLTETETP